MVQDIWFRILPAVDLAHEPAHESDRFEHKAGSGFTVQGTGLRIWFRILFRMYGEGHMGLPAVDFAHEPAHESHGREREAR